MWGLTAVKIRFTILNFITAIFTNYSKNESQMIPFLVGKQIKSNKLPNCVINVALPKLPSLILAVLIHSKGLMEIRQRCLCSWLK